MRDNDTRREFVSVLLPHLVLGAVAAETALHKDDVGKGSRVFTAVVGDLGIFCFAFDPEQRQRCCVWTSQSALTRHDIIPTLMGGATSRSGITNMCTCSYTIGTAMGAIVGLCLAPHMDMGQRSRGSNSWSWLDDPAHYWATVASRAPLQCPGALQPCAMVDWRFAVQPKTKAAHLADELSWCEGRVWSVKSVGSMSGKTQASMTQSCLFGVNERMANC